MEEKIIINGVDVSECRFYQETLKAYNNGKISSFKGYGFCTHNIKGLNNAGCYAETFARCLNNNCYYKQLKRLEQENEELKELNRNLNALIWYIYCGSEDNVAEDVISEYYNAKNEYDVIYLKNFWKKIYSLGQTESRIKKDKLEHTLEEIRGIVSGNYETLDPQAKQEIQTIITEAIGE